MRVFLSHASESKLLLQAIVERLPPHVERWLDVDKLPVGARLAARIEQAIVSECDYVIVFLDAVAVASDWVRREVREALAHEVDLQRPFLVPVLLADVEAALPELWPEERIYLRAYDHEPQGLAAAGDALAAQLFALSSVLIEGLRSTGRRGLLQQFDRELSAFEQSAFLWLATLRNSLAVLSTNQAAFDHVTQALAGYNAAADVLIPRLGHHVDRIGTAWAMHRGLTQRFRDLAAFIENDVYHRAVFELNQVLAMIHALDAAGGRSDEPISVLDARKDALLEQADRALKEMADRAADVVARLSAEI